MRFSLFVYTMHVAVWSKHSCLSWESELGGGHKNGWRSLQTSYHMYASLPFSTDFFYLLPWNLSFFRDRNRGGYTSFWFWWNGFVNFGVYVGQLSSVVTSIDFSIFGSDWHNGLRLANMGLLCFFSRVWDLQPSPIEKENIGWLFAFKVLLLVRWFTSARYLVGGLWIWALSLRLYGNCF